MEKDKELKRILKTSVCGFICENELNEQEKQFINKIVKIFLQNRRKRRLFLLYAQKEKENLSKEMIL